MGFKPAICEKMKGPIFNHGILGSNHFVFRQTDISYLMFEQKDFWIINIDQLTVHVV